MTLDLTRFGQWRKYGILKSFVNSFSFSLTFQLCTAICPSKGVRNSRHLILRPYFWCYFVFYSSRCHQRQIDLHHFDLKVAKIARLLLGSFIVCVIVTKIREINMVIFSQSSNLDKSQMFVQATKLLKLQFFPYCLVYLHFFQTSKKLRGAKKGKWYFVTKIVLTYCEKMF